MKLNAYKAAIIGVTGGLAGAAYAHTDWLHDLLVSPSALISGGNIAAALLFSAGGVISAWRRSIDNFGPYAALGVMALVVPQLMAGHGREDGMDMPALSRKDIPRYTIQLATLVAKQAESHRAETDRLEATIAGLRQRLTSLDEEIRAQVASEVTSGRVELNEARKELDAREASLEALRVGELDRLRKLQSEATAQLAAIEAERKTMAERLVAADARAQTFQAQAEARVAKVTAEQAAARTADASASAKELAQLKKALTDDVGAQLSGVVKGVDRSIAAFERSAAGSETRLAALASRQEKQVAELQVQLAETPSAAAKAVGGEFDRRVAPLVDDIRSTGAATIKRVDDQVARVDAAVAKMEAVPGAAAKDVAASITSSLLPHVASVEVASKRTVEGQDELGKVLKGFQSSLKTDVGALVDATRDQVRSATDKIDLASRDIKSSGVELRAGIAEDVRGELKSTAEAIRAANGETAVTMVAAILDAEAKINKSASDINSTVGVMRADLAAAPQRISDQVGATVSTVPAKTAEAVGSQLTRSAEALKTAATEPLAQFRGEMESLTATVRAQPDLAVKALDNRLAGVTARLTGAVDVMERTVVASSGARAQTEALIAKAAEIPQTVQATLAAMETIPSKTAQSAASAVSSIATRQAEMLRDLSAVRGQVDAFGKKVDKVSASAGLLEATFGKVLAAQLAVDASVKQLEKTSSTEVAATKGLQGTVVELKSQVDKSLIQSAQTVASTVASGAEAQRTFKASFEQFKTETGRLSEVVARIVGMQTRVDAIHAGVQKLQPLASGSQQDAALKALSRQISDIGARADAATADIKNVRLQIASGPAGGQVQAGANRTSSVPPALLVQQTNRLEAPPVLPPVERAPGQPATGGAFVQAAAQVWKAGSGAQACQPLSMESADGWGAALAKGFPGMTVERVDTEGHFVWAKGDGGDARALPMTEIVRASGCRLRG